jgi:hypothetical protein
MKTPITYLQWKVRELSLASLVVLLAAWIIVNLTSCSGAGTVRTPKGTELAGTFSFLGKQSVGHAEITTASGDRVVLDGYSTQNPDPARMTVTGVITAVNYDTILTLNVAAETGGANSVSILKGSIASISPFA